MSNLKPFAHNHTKESYLYFNEYSHFAESNLYYVQILGYEDCTQGYFLERENFDSFLLVYTINGEGTLKYDSKTYKLTPKTCFLIDCNEYHNYYNSGKDNWQFHFIHFNGFSARQIYEKIIGLNGVVFNGDDSILSLLLEAEVLSKNITQFSEIYFSEIIASLVASIFRYSNTEFSKKVILVENVISYIKDHFDTNIKIDDLAKRYFVNEFYLQHLFKKSTSYSIHEYILKLRLEKGKNLLVTTSLSITEVAESSGFDNVNNFIRFFKNKTGLTPLNFRKYHTTSGYLKEQNASLTNKE